MTTSTDLPRRIGAPHRGAARWANLLRRSVALEAAGWRGIGRTLARRPRAPAGASAHSWDQPIRAVLVTFLVVSALEVVIVDIITQRWPVVRYPLLVVGIWGVLFMVGMLLSNRTRPHAVGPDGLLIRSGGDVEVVLAWDLIESVERRRRPLSEAPTLSLTGPPQEQALNIVVQDGTHVDVELVAPTRLRLPQGEVTVSSVRFAVDDPTAFLAAVRDLAG